MHYKTVLSIAGSDSCGGAGIQADIKTCTALGCYAMTAITAVTVQSTTGVEWFQSMPPRLIGDQIRCVCTDIRPDAVKIGMVPSPEAARAIADALFPFRFRHIVLDPVMVATAGKSIRLSSDSVQHMLLRSLANPDTEIILTPNLVEAEILAKICGFDSMPSVRDLAMGIGVRWLLLKGGHASGSTLTDVLYDAATNTTAKFTHPRIDTPNTHGTGCSLSSAIASNLALGLEMREAVGKAIDWLTRAIADGANYSIGHGNGPVNHLFNFHPYDSID